ARLQVHAVRRPGQPRAGTGVHQVVSDGLSAFRQQGRYEGIGGTARQAVARALQLSECRRLRSGGSRWHWCNLRAARRHTTGNLRRAAKESEHSAKREVVEGAVEVAGEYRDGRRTDWPVRALFAVWPEGSRCGYQRTA